MKQEVGKPIKIAGFLESSNSSAKRLFLNDLELRSILDFNDPKPVSILSITGPSTIGKSFYLSTILNYFNRNETTTTHFKEEDMAFNELPWNCSETNSLSSGIYMWNKSFDITQQFGGTTVYLMNIHQANDISEEESMQLVGFSVLISSSVMENLFEVIPKTFAQFLEIFNAHENGYLIEIRATADDNKHQLNSLHKRQGIIQSSQTHKSVKVLTIVKSCHTNSVNTLIQSHLEKFADTFSILGFELWYTLSEWQNHGSVCWPNIPWKSICGEHLVSADILNCFNFYFELLRYHYTNRSE